MISHETIIAIDGHGRPFHRTRNIKATKTYLSTEQNYKVSKAYKRLRKIKKKMRIEGD